MDASAPRRWALAEERGEEPDYNAPPKAPVQPQFHEKLDRGLTLTMTVGASGARTWSMTTYAGGKPKVRKIGSWPEMRAEEAKEGARARRLNPEAFEPKEPPPAAKTFEEVARGWFADHVEAKLTSAGEMKRHLDVYVLPRWEGKAFADIKRFDLVELLKAVVNEGPAPGVAGKGGKVAKRRKRPGLKGGAQAIAVYGTLRRIFSAYALLHEGYASPCVRGLLTLVPNAKTRRRERFLSHEEIRTLWRAAEAEGGATEGLAKIVLLTGSRMGKVASMKWDDLVGGVWRIRVDNPDPDREKGTAEALQLPPLALAVIAALPKVESNPYLFAGRLAGKPLNSFGAIKEKLDARIPKGAGRWTWHDLRRTARSLLAECGVSKDVAERVLGHKQQGIVAVYDRHTYFREKSDALQSLANHIERIVDPPPDNVVQLRERSLLEA